MYKHILIIDDDTDELRKLRLILSREGYNIMTASDRKTAIEICANIDIKYVLSSAKAINIQQVKNNKH